MNEQKRLLVVVRDEIQLYCRGIAALLQQQEGFHVELTDDQNRSLERLRATVHLILFCPPANAPAQLTRTIRQLRQGAKLMLIFGPDMRWTIRQFQVLEADGAISSESDHAELLFAINVIVSRGLKYVSPLLIDPMTHTTTFEPWAALSSKEKQVALYLTNGVRDIEIAGELSISPKTVNTYKSRIFRKLGVRNAVQLLRLWQNNEC